MKKTIIITKGTETMKVVEMRKALDVMALETTQMFKERDDIVAGVILSFLTGNHILLVGPPGTGKSATVNHMTEYIKDSVLFYWLVTKYTVPEELFGPPSIAELEKGKYQRITTNKLPEANFAFIDEIFKSSSSILNCLLTIMNERLFFDGDQVKKVPLITMIGASNELPTESEELGALYDRFLLRYELKYLRERQNISGLLTDKITPATPLFSAQDLLDMRKDFEKSDIIYDIDFYINLREKLAENGVFVSDRRFKQMIELVRAVAYLSGRKDTIQKDYMVLKNAFWNEPSQIPVVGKIINEFANPLMQIAIEKFDEASEIYANCLKMVDSDPKQKMLHASEAHAKLKEIMDDVNKNIKSAAGADTSELTEVSNKIMKDMIKPLVRNVMGVTD